MTQAGEAVLADLEATHTALGPDTTAAEPSPTSAPALSTAPPVAPTPTPGTHLARRDTPYPLYLVRTRRWQKFGAGDERRVRTHVRNGAEVLQVLQAPFEHVILAETTLKQHHA